MLTAFPLCECLYCPKEKQDECYGVMTDTNGLVAPCLPSYAAYKNSAFLCSYSSYNKGRKRKGRRS